MVDRPAELEALDALVGTWVTQVQVPGVAAGEARFEWALDGRYLLLRMTGPQPYPASLSVIAADERSTGGYLQHYFDARGVVRLYRMQLRAGVWSLARTEADFSALDFAQRFEGRFSDDGARIDGHWDTSRDGGTTWELDFGLTFTRS
jgi:hypothetical protein